MLKENKTSWILYKKTYPAPGRHQNRTSASLLERQRRPAHRTSVSLPEGCPACQLQLFREDQQLERQTFFLMLTFYSSNHLTDVKLWSILSDGVFFFFPQKLLTKEELSGKHIWWLGFLDDDDKNWEHVPFTKWKCLFYQITLSPAYPVAYTGLRKVNWAFWGTKYTHFKA